MIEDGLRAPSRWRSCKAELGKPLGKKGVKAQPSLQEFAASLRSVFALPAAGEDTRPSVSVWRSALERAIGGTWRGTGGQSTDQRRLRSATARCPRNKAPDGEGLVPEILAAMPSKLVAEMAGMLTDIVRGTAVKPEGWNQIRFQMLAKPGKKDYQQPSSWRPIAGTRLASKLVARVYGARMYTAQEEDEDNGQVGFRKGWSADDGLFTLQQLLEKASRWAENPGSDEESVLFFLDVKGALDRVYHGAVAEDLAALGAHTDTMLALACLYEGCTGVIVKDGLVSEGFPMEHGGFGKAARGARASSRRVCAEPCVVGEKTCREHVWEWT